MPYYKSTLPPSSTYQKEMLKCLNTPYKIYKKYKQASCSKVTASMLDSMKTVSVVPQEVNIKQTGPTKFIALSYMCIIVLEIKRRILAANHIITVLSKKLVR
uniref:CSON012687 protein n=1 Tax=Culicoides sonorensis TaxID=179676 RepID=A0A336MAB2_CULSO